jgi:large subunit ribosomal protein L30
MAKIRVKWIKSAIGFSSRQRRTLVALGFKKLQSVVEHEDTPQIRGMIDKVRHLVDWTTL